MGKGIVDQLKKEFDLEVTWLPFEVHPATPPEGVLLSEKFPGVDRDAMVQEMNRMGEPYGIRFGAMKRLYNSRAALEVSELARDRGAYDAMHEKLFSACLKEGKNIADPEVLYGIAEEVGLKRDEVARVLKEGTYSNRLASALAEARSGGVSAVPTFVVNDSQVITGAQPLERFRFLLASDTGVSPRHDF